MNTGPVLKCCTVRETQIKTILLASNVVYYTGQRCTYWL